MIKTIVFFWLKIWLFGKKTETSFKQFEREPQKKYPARTRELLNLQNRYVDHQGSISKINGTPFLQDFILDVKSC